MKVASRPKPVNDPSAAPARAHGASTMVPIISDGRCVGFLLRRGREGIEAFDRNELSLGLYTCPTEAARAVENSAAPACPGDGDGR
jgi:hypothetical protein